MRKLASVQNWFYDIGVGLCVEYHLLDGMKHSSDRDSMKLYSVLQEWINCQASPVTWEMIIEVIRNQKSESCQ